MPRPFTPNAWFWFVAGDRSRVWSSAAGAYLPVTDAAYQGWLAAGGVTTNIDTEENLTNVLDGYGIIGPIVLKKYVDAERDRRIATGFVFNGKAIQLDHESQTNIDGATKRAESAIAAGAQAGDINWCGVQPFNWIATDNTEIPMDAQTVVQMGFAAFDWKGHQIFAARAIKAMAPIPHDFANDRYWPQVATNS